MGNIQSEAGKYYNNSTLEFIKSQFISKEKDFFYEYSEEFFNDPIKILDVKKLLKYINKSCELKECYVDELRNANLIQSNYKPFYRVYEAKYKEENRGSIKLIKNIEIYEEVDTEDIKDKLSEKNGNKIINISGKRNLKKREKNDEKLLNKSFLAENILMKKIACLI